METTPNSARIPMAHVNIVSREAVNVLTVKVYADLDETWLPKDFIFSQPTQRNHDGTTIGDVDIEHFCAPVVHPVTGETITSYKKLADDPLTRSTWTTGYGKAFGRMAQGDEKTGAKGKNCILVMNHDEIANIPKDRVVTYARVVVDFRLQKMTQIESESQREEIS